MLQVGELQDQGTQTWNGSSESIPFSLFGDLNEGTPQWDPLNNPRARDTENTSGLFKRSHGYSDLTV